MKALQQTHTLDLLLFASPVYWADAPEREAAAKRIEKQLQHSLGEILQVRLKLTLIENAESANEFAQAGQANRPAIIVPMSGGVQPWMLKCADVLTHVALLNAYLPGILDHSDSHALMHRNAHPACTDFYAHLRLQRHSCIWLDSLESLKAFATGWQGADRLRNATFLKIGETEPWVINSCRSPERFAEKWGLQVKELDRSAVYDEMKRVSAERVSAIAENWIQGASSLKGIKASDVNDACQVVAAMESLLETHKADGLSMACFAMIGEADTTSCLALSALNDSALAIGACEGDLDAAATLFLLRAMGADFVWIGNPILHPGRRLELAHCTAPRCACGKNLPYQLMRHHESGRGVAPEVTLPSDQTVTLARIGDDLNKIAIHGGITRRIEKLPTCHTQIQIEMEDTRTVVDTLLGTHLVMSYGDWTHSLRHAARFLELDAIP